MTELEQYESVKRWMLRRGERKTTRKMYLMALKKFCAYAELNPDELIAERKQNVKNEDEAIRHKDEERIQAWFKQLTKEGISKASASAYVAFIRSFYKNNYYPLTDTGDYYKPMKRRAPTIDELRLLLEYANPLEKALIMVGKDSGLSAAELLGLKYGDIKADFEKGKVPIHISIVRKKENVEFETFIGQEGVEALKIHFRNKSLNPNDKVFKINYQAAVERFIRLQKEAGLRETGLQPLHGFRKFFDTRLALVKIHPAISKYWMGHKIGGDVEMRYIIPDTETQRKLYEDAYDTLRIQPRMTKEAVDVEKEAKLRILHKLAQDWGIADILDEQIKKMRIVTIDERIAFYEQKLKQKPSRETNGSGVEIVTVSFDELDEYLSQGFEIVAQNGEKYKLKKVSE